MKRPVIGITSDIELIDCTEPQRPFYQLDSAIVGAITQCGGIPLILPHNTQCIDDYIDLIDGFIISGDNYRFTDPQLFPELETNQGRGDTPLFKINRTRFELELARQLLHLDIPTLAICAGYQILNLAAGGSLIVSLTEALETDVQHRQTEPLNMATHEVLIPADTLMRKIVGRERMPINSLHSQGIYIAESARISAVADDGLVEAIEIPNKKFCMGTQWHPEFLAGPGDEKILRAFISASQDS